MLSRKPFSKPGLNPQGALVSEFYEHIINGVAETSLFFMNAALVSDASLETPDLP